jgi:hypothetical protein
MVEENKINEEYLKDVYLKARIPFTINVYSFNGNDYIEIIESCFREDHFVKGNKEHAEKFLKDIARILGVAVEVTKK